MRHLNLFTALSVLPLLILGCSGEKPLEIAVVLPESGADAVYGEPLQRGVELAFEELERRFEEGEYPYEIELILLDSESRPERAAELLAEAYDGGARAAVGGVTPAEAVALAEVAERAERVLLVPAAPGPALPEGSRHAFLLSPSVVKEGNKMASFAALELNLKKVAVLAPETASARALIEAFRSELARNDGEVVAEVTYPMDAGELSEPVGRALEARPQAIYLVDTAEPTARLLEELDRRRFAGAVLSTSAIAVPRVLAAAGRRAEGMLMTRAGFDPASDEPRIQGFVQSYEERHGELPGLVAAYGYDAVMVLAAAFEGEGRRAYELRKGVRGLHEYPGVTGFIQFDEHGEVGGFPRIYVVQNGQPRAYEELQEGKKRSLARRLARLEGQSRKVLQGG